MADFVSETALHRLRAAEGFLFDMDGTLVLANADHRDATALPGAVDMLKTLIACGVPFLVFTNGTFQSPLALSGMLERAGLPVTPAQMMTPSTTAAVLLRDAGCRRVMMLSPSSAWMPLIDAGLEVIGSAERADVDAVYVAEYRECSMDDLHNAVHAICDGAKFYTSNRHPFFVTESGRAFGTSRAISSGIASLCGKRPFLTGKPSVAVLEEAAKRMGTVPDRIAVVGDDASLEMRMARRGNALGVLVRTGMTGRVELDSINPLDRPDLYLAGVASLADVWREGQKGHVHV